MTRMLLAATDFSPPARHALERAALIAQAHSDARLTLAHVVSATLLEQLRHLLPAETGPLESGPVAQAEQKLAELAATLAARCPCIIDTTVVPGAAADALPVLAEAQRAGLLVMGAHGVHFVRERLLGSTVGRVLRKSRRPLLAVKQRAQAPYRRILAAVDFSPHAAAAINAAHAWLPDADIVLLHAFEVEFESTLRLAGMDDDRVNAHRRIRAGPRRRSPGDGQARSVGGGGTAARQRHPARARLFPLRRVHRLPELEAAPMPAFTFVAHPAMMAPLFPRETHFERP